MIFKPLDHLGGDFGFPKWNHLGILNSVSNVQIFRRNFTYNNFGKWWILELTSHYATENIQNGHSLKFWPLQSTYDNPSNISSISISFPRVRLHTLIVDKLFYTRNESSSYVKPTNFVIISPCTFSEHRVPKVMEYLQICLRVYCAIRRDEVIKIFSYHKWSTRVKVDVLLLCTYIPIAVSSFYMYFFLNVYNFSLW